MHRTLNHLGTGLLVPNKSNCHSPSMDWVSGILMELCSSITEGNLKASLLTHWSLIPHNICNPKMMSWQHQSLIHWGDVSCYSGPPSCPEHCRLWHVPGAGEEKNRDRDWATAQNIYQSPKHFSELFTYLPKIPVFCFQKKDVMIFLCFWVS